MHTTLLIINALLVLLVLLLAFLVVGALRALGLLRWRVEQIEVTSPRRVGRDGLLPGKRAPDFTLPSAFSGPVSLSDFAGRKRLIVFTQSGCGPCHDIMPELNRVQRQGQYQVLVVNNGSAEETRRWAADVKARFPVLTQDKWEISKRYEVFATPFAFVIDEQGLVSSKGLVGTSQYLGFALSGAGHAVQRPNRVDRDSTAIGASGPPPAPDHATRRNSSTSSRKELTHAWETK
jgi:methylamine dehydrogenase accessory protein MauD